MKNEEPEFIHIEPAHIAVKDTFALLLDSIAPRPIAFASTVDKNGRPNLSPFSFFNGFGANPPILVFSPSRRGRDNTTKHTYDNIKEVAEVCINVVSYDMVHQVSLASSEYPHGVNEFEKSGFTMLKSDLIKPFRVAESPIQFECKVINVIETGDQGAAGNLVICEILKVHINSNVLTDGEIDINKLDLVGRMGGPFYVRASGDALFQIPKPTDRGIGVDALPKEVINSNVLTGNDLGQLGNMTAIPGKNDSTEIPGLSELESSRTSEMNDEIFEEELHMLAKELINENKVELALKLLFRVHANN